MGRIKEGLLNGLLALLVLVSVGLSSLVWFPSESNELLGAREPQVQVPPPATVTMDTRMPDVFRPERITVHRKDGTLAVLPMATGQYLGLWGRLSEVLNDLRPGSGPFVAPDQEVAGTDAESVTLDFPAVLRLADWGERWGWLPAALANASVRIDRITLVLAPKPGAFASGPSGATYRLVTPSEQVITSLQESLKAIPEERFVKSRTFKPEQISMAIAPGLVVQDLTAVPVVRLTLRRPEVVPEEARFFPDLSVVRQIDEVGARSYTDGQRLLRMTDAGVLEYRAAGDNSGSLDLSRSVRAAEEWVGAHGGWPQELLLTRFFQRGDHSELRFDVRYGDNIPVETAIDVTPAGPGGTERQTQGAMEVQLTGDRTAAKVYHFVRYPGFTAFQVSNVTQAVIAPEEALRAAVEELRGLRYETVRQMHMAYLLHPDGERWSVDPCWEFSAGELRVYVQAAVGVVKRQISIIQ